MIKKRIIFLISSLFVFIPCFSNATLVWDLNWSNGWNQVVWIDLIQWEQGDFLDIDRVKTNNDFVIRSLWWGDFNFNYDSVNYDSIYQLRTNNRGGVSWFFFWNNWKLIYHQYFDNPTRPGTHTLQVSWFALVNINDFWNFSKYWSFSYSLDDVLNSSIQLDHQIFGVWRGWDWSLPNNALNLWSKIVYCLGDWNNYFCATCYWGDFYDNVGCYWWDNVIDLWLTSSSNIWDIVWQNLNGISPVVLKNILPSTDVPNWSNSSWDLTNWDIIEWYNIMWLTDEFCYWGFDINNIFQSWELPENFTWYRRGGGANILDIWDIYSWAYWNDPVSFIRSFYVAYENNNYASFYWYPKAVYGFFNQYFMVSNDWLGFWGSTLATFTPMSIWEYCNLRFKSDPNAKYNWNSWDPQFAYNNKNLWSNEWKFNFSWNNGFFSWSLSWFENPTDFFGSLNAIFQWWLGDIWYRAPLLPSYILVFLFAIILIRMLSH